MDITKELSKNQTILLLMPNEKYNQVMLDVAKQLSKKNVCYVTLNKTYASLTELFKKKTNLDNIVFIDTISKTFKETPDQTKNVYFASSPGALTEISLTVSKFLKHEFDYIIFDSITTLMIYQKKAMITRFITGLANKIRASNTKAVFYALKIPEQESTIKEISMSVDKVVDVK